MHNLGVICRVELDSINPLRLTTPFFPHFDIGERGLANPSASASKFVAALTVRICQRQGLREILTMSDDDYILRQDCVGYCKWQAHLYSTPRVKEDVNAVAYAQILARTLDGKRMMNEQPRSLCRSYNTRVVTCIICSS